MQISHFGTLLKNAIALAILGVLSLSVVVIILKLPQKIKTGERGQAAIQLLDEMRRPFLTIKQVETRLIETADVEASTRALSLAIGSATDLLERYRHLARYNEALSTNVGVLSVTFENWMSAEHHLFSSFEAVSSRAGDGVQPTRDLMPSFASATLGFLNTLDVLGAGEGPIHADIDEGRVAGHLFQVLGLTLLLYFIGVAFWLQRARNRQEEAFLQQHIRSEQETRALQQSLSESLAKVLSGFIPICASCKSVRGEDNQWTQVEVYVSQKTDAMFSHGICPKCAERLYGDFLPLKEVPRSP